MLHGNKHANWRYLRCDQPCFLRKRNGILQDKKIVVKPVGQVLKASTDCEDTRLCGPIGLRNSFTPEEITIILFDAPLLFSPRSDVLAPDPPEFEILVPSTGHNNITGGSKSAEQDARFVSVSNLSDTFEGGIRMNHDRVSWVAVSGQNLLPVG